MSRKGPKMSITSYVFGHLVFFDPTRKAWFYADDQSPATCARPCPKCGQMPTPEGFDPCLGFIPGASAACCGHGVETGYLLQNGQRYEISPTSS